MNSVLWLLWSIQSLGRYSAVSAVRSSFEEDFIKAMKSMTTEKKPIMLEDLRNHVFSWTTKTSEGEKHLFKRGRQEDASEFLLAVIERLEFIGVSLNMTFSTVTSGCKCGHHSVNASSHLAITLAFTSNSLYGCLRSFGEREPLEDYTCSQCGKKTDTAERVDSLDESTLPEYVIIVLKRFDERGKKKKTGPVTFPVDGLKFSSKSSSPEFELSAVVLHNGELHRGHYRAAIRTKASWYLMNDDLVTAVQPGFLQTPNVTKEAYIFLYRKKDQTRCSDSGESLVITIDNNFIGVLPLNCDVLYVHFIHSIRENGAFDIATASA
jgi:uncharacterized UBP type Zn finger protein